MSDVKLIIAWMPGETTSSLRTGTRALAPAPLYADEVTVLSLEADDSAELADAREVEGSNLGVKVYFDALTSSHVRPDWTGDHPSVLDREAWVTNDHEARQVLARRCIDELEQLPESQLAVAGLALLSDLYLLDWDGFVPYLFDNDAYFEMNDVKRSWGTDPFDVQERLQNTLGFAHDGFPYWRYPDLGMKILLAEHRRRTEQGAWGW